MRYLEGTDDSNLCTVTVGLALYEIKKTAVGKAGGRRGGEGHVLGGVRTKPVVFQRDYSFSLAQKFPPFVQASDQE